MARKPARFFGYSTLLLSLSGLLTGCMSLEPAHLPSESLLYLQNGQIQSPDCRTLQDPSEFRDGPLQLTHRPSVAFGCATYSNLAKMIANPQDLEQPRRYPGQDATTAGAAVQRYHDDKVKPLLNTTTSQTGSTSSSGGSSK